MTKLGTDHVDGTCLSTRVFFVYIFFGKHGVFSVKILTKYIFFGKRGGFSARKCAGLLCRKITKFVNCLCELGSKIEELESTERETVHGDGT